jgi:phosphoribosylformylglycinamidine synthase
VPDVRRCVTMDLKEPRNNLYLIGVTRDEMGGSHFHLVHGLAGGQVPRVDLTLAPRVFATVHEAINAGLVRSCHDVSEGGVAVALAEMAFAGNLGADIRRLPDLPLHVALFAESTSRFVLEVPPEQTNAFAKLMSDMPCLHLGQTCKEPRLRIAGPTGEWAIWAPLDQLKEVWQKPLRW